eukprot:5931997-Amphidinium_carterae.1
MFRVLEADERRHGRHHNRDEEDTEDGAYSVGELHADFRLRLPVALVQQYQEREWDGKRSNELPAHI